MPQEPGSTQITPSVNVLLSGRQRGSLTMCTFRTRSLTAAQSLWRKAWNVSHRQMQAALKGISITSRQAGPYVVVISLRDISRLVPCTMTSTRPRGNVLAHVVLHPTAGNHTLFICAHLTTGLFSALMTSASARSSK